MSLLGIDVGTTGVKVTAYAVDGRLLASAYREYAVQSPRPHTAELDSSAVLQHVLDAIAATAAATGEDAVTALCVSSMGEAMTPVARDGTVLGSAILHVDPRGEECVERLRERIGQERFYAINPNVLGVNYSAPKLCWRRDHEGDLYARADRFLLWGDLVGVALGCEAVTSPSLANRTLLMDIRREDWSDELLEATGIEREKLPRIVPAGTVAGEVSASAAARCGLRAGVRVVVGGHDQALNALGAGAIDPGQSVCGIGTVECTTPVYDHIPPAGTMLRYGLNVEHHVLPDRYVSFLYNQAGSLVRWFRDTFAAADRRGAGAGEDLYAALFAEMPPRPADVLVVPQFEMTGPPHFAPGGRGTIHGLHADTSRGEILRAILEGETFYFVELLDALHSLGIDTSEFLATGGGAKSDAWLQLKSDILNTPFARPVNTECGTAGAAILAGLGTGVYASANEATEQFVRIERRFEPRQAMHEAYRERYARYRELCGRLG